MRPTNRSLALTALVGALSLASQPSLAYGPDGHRTVGAIADELIKGTEAEKHVRELLHGDTLSHVSVWADCAKNVGKDFVYKPDARFPECNDFDSQKDWFQDFVKRNWDQCLPHGQAVGPQVCHAQYHFTDVSNLRNGYDVHDAGATPHDIVHAINAAIVVLRGQASPEPFNFIDKREALTVLAHYLGDEHQPLHVVAIYLGNAGQTLDPDGLAHFDDYSTAGGNHLVYGVKQNLHSDWDAVPTNLTKTDPHFSVLVDAARLVPRTSGDILSWSSQWATDTLTFGKPAFSGLSYQFKNKDNTGTYWSVSGNTAADYVANEAALKEVELERGGARLAQILQALWPDPPAPPQPHPTNPSDPKPYLQTTDLPAVKAWLPGQPASASAAQARDDAIFWSTRPHLTGARGRSAAEDDVWDPKQVIQRFAPSLGLQEVPTGKVSTLLNIITRAQLDAGNLVHPMKADVAAGGRLRPFVANPGTPTCLTPVDLAGHRDDDLVTFSLAQSGSYPSTHSLVGWFVGSLLAELAPEHGAATLARGLEFGDSRVVCGFHYQSDVDAGRLAAAALMARLHANDAFQADLAVARKELRDTLNEKVK